MANDILDAVYGCLIGGAIGDAMGAPVEMMYYSDIREQYGKVDTFYQTRRRNSGDHYGEEGQEGPPGSISDDTTLRHYICLAIVRKGGRITPDDLAEVLLDSMNPNRFWINERIILQKLKIGMNPWETGRGAPPAGCACMAIAPIGIINAGDPAQAYLDAFAIASLNQDHDDRDAAATLAAAVAAAFLPNATVKDIIETMFKHSTFAVNRALEFSMEIASASQTVDEFAEKFYATMLDWKWPLPRKRWNKERTVSGSSLEIVPAVAGIFHLCNGKVNQCIIEGASFGRDCDTIANIVGEIAGAMQGASAIRQEWIDESEKANAPFFEELEGDSKANFYAMAQRLVDALKKEQQTAQKRVEMLSRILSA